MAGSRAPVSTLCARAAACAIAVAVIGCVSGWTHDAPAGIFFTVLLGVIGILFTIAAHRHSRR